MFEFYTYLGVQIYFLWSLTDYFGLWKKKHLNMINKDKYDFEKLWSAVNLRQRERERKRERETETEGERHTERKRERQREVFRLVKNI